MRHAVIGNGPDRGKWMRSKELDESLQAFAVPNPIGESYFTKTGEGWLGPDDTLKAYRSRVSYAREVDARRASKKVAAKGG
jgi:hypothetical protein